MYISRDAYIYIERERVLFMTKSSRGVGVWDFQGSTGEGLQGSFRSPLAYTGGGSQEL